MSSPIKNRILSKGTLKILHSYFFFIVWKLKRCKYSGTKFFSIIGVHKDGLFKFIRSTRKFTQNEGAVGIDSTRDKLLGDQIHSVDERSYQHHISGKIHRSEFIKLKRFV